MASSETNCSSLVTFLALITISPNGRHRPHVPFHRSRAKLRRQRPRRRRFHPHPIYPLSMRRYVVDAARPVGFEERGSEYSSLLGASSSWASIGYLAKGSLPPGADLRERYERPGPTLFFDGLSDGQFSRHCAAL